MKPLVSVDELRRLMPNLSLGKAGYYAPFLNAAMLEQGIVSKRRRCGFLPQLSHESAQLRYMEEIASGAAYEGRRDLGNIRPGDGKRYKGRGPIQLTGRANYRKFGQLLGVDLEARPELAAKPEYGFRVAALFWKLNGLNELADDLTLDAGGADYKIVRRITRKINGGYNGLEDRWKYYKSAIKVLHDDSSSSPSPVAPPVARPAESVNEQQEAAESQAENSAKVSTDTGTDLLGTVANSSKAKTVGLKLWPRLRMLWPRIVKHGSAALGWLYAFYEAHKWGMIVIVLVMIVGLLWLVYHNRKKLAPHVVKLLK